MHGPDNDHTPFDNKMAALRNAVKDYKESPEGKKQIYDFRRAIEKRVKAVAVCYFSFAPLTFTILYPTAAMVIGAGVAAYAVRDVYKFGSQNFLNKAWKSVKSSWKQVGSDALFLAKLPFKAIGYIFSKDEPSQKGDITPASANATPAPQVEAAGTGFTQKLRNIFAGSAPRDAAANSNAPAHSVDITPAAKPSNGPTPPKPRGPEYRR